MYKHNNKRAFFSVLYYFNIDSIMIIVVNNAIPKVVNNGNNDSRNEAPAPK